MQIFKTIKELKQYIKSCKQKNKIIGLLVMIFFLITTGLYALAPVNHIGEISDKIESESRLTLEKLEKEVKDLIIGGSKPVGEFFDRMKKFFLSKKIWGYAGVGDIAFEDDFFSANHPEYPKNRAVALKEQREIICIGDLHGDLAMLYALLEQTDFFNCIYKKNPPIWLFMGDYVDRGKESLETVVTVLNLKEKFPRNIIVLRGNHETRTRAVQGNFRQQLRELGPDNIYNKVHALFDELPLMVITDQKRMIVHGGIPIDGEINLKNCLVGDNVMGDLTAIYQLLWNDPLWHNPFGESVLPSYNAGRGRFSMEQFNIFKQRTGIEQIIRAHEEVEGPEFAKTEGFPGVINIFTTGGESKDSDYGYDVNKPYIARIKEGKIDLEPITVMSKFA